METVKNAIIDFAQDVWAWVKRESQEVWVDLKHTWNVYPRSIYLALLLILIAWFV